MPADFKLKVFSVVNHAFSVLPKTAAVRQIFAHHGYDHLQYVDTLWFGWPSKLIGMIKLVHELDESYTHVMLCDGADVVTLAPPEEIMERWRKLGHPWVFNAEVNIWSPKSFTPEEYPTPQCTFRYLNAGACIGEREHVLKWYSRWTKEFTEGPLCVRGDQDWYAERFIRHYPDAIQLDHNCELFQAMCGAEMGSEEDRACHVTRGQVYNSLTDTYPLIIHYNGGTDITRPDRSFLWDHWRTA